MATHSSTLAWKIPWVEEPGRLQSMGSLRVGHNWATSLSPFTFMHWRRKWQPTPVFLPGESPGTGEPGGLPSMGSHRVRHDWSDLAVAEGIWVSRVFWVLDSLRVHPSVYFLCIHCKRKLILGKRSLVPYHQTSQYQPAKLLSIWNPEPRRDLLFARCQSKQIYLSV